MTEVADLDQLQLDKVVHEIESAFGPEPPFSERQLSDKEKSVLSEVFGDEGYQRYLQDQVNRQIIRDYLTNAVLLGCISDERFTVLAHQAATVQGRASLSIHMLMHSVEEANDIPLNAGAGLKQVRRAPGSPPQLELIP